MDRLLLYDDDGDKLGPNNPTEMTNRCTDMFLKPLFQSIRQPSSYLSRVVSTDIRTPSSILTISAIFMLLIYSSIPVSSAKEAGIELEKDKEQQYDCEIVNPSFIENDSTYATTFLMSCPRELTILFNLSRGEYVINVVRNERLISDRFFKLQKVTALDKLGTKINSYQSGQAEMMTSLNNDTFYRNNHYIPIGDQLSDHCHYLGTVNDDDRAISAMSIVGSKLLSGFFYLNDYSYHLIANSSDASTLAIITRKDSPFPSNQQLIDCANKLKEPSSHNETLRRSRRAATSTSLVSNRISRRRKKSSLDNKVLHGPYQSNSSSLFVELLVVHDHSQFKEYNKDATLIAERTMQIVNIMNAFYRQLNIYVALVGVVLWTSEDEIKLTDDGDSTLTNFLKYRHEKLLPRYHHDNAQLITSTSFNGSVVGKALKGPICTHDHSGGVNTDHSHSAAIVAVTLAHELGHNLGMEHDDDEKCSCPDDRCIMASSSSLVHPKHWSSCSLDYLEDSRKHGLLDCLTNEPDQVFGPTCGNGFVEEGEDCDIGEPIPSYGTSKSKNRETRPMGLRLSSPGLTRSSWLANPCCDRSTCKFMPNATCAQGPCCDLSTCSVFNSSELKVCRPKKSECDFDEHCDGVSEYCPQDVHFHDGLECGPTLSMNHGDLESSAINSASYNRSRSYCFQGNCASHESQCQLLWGSGGTTSRDICYDQNIHGNTSGNCGYDRKEKTYHTCDLEDTLCGMLHCVHNQPSSSDNSRKTGKLSYGFESASILTVSFFVMSSHERIYCHGAIIDAGPYMRDPGLVPNGASCGHEKICLNQKCVPVSDVLYKDWCKSDCNGNGICDNTGTCHCNDGTIGTSCYQFFGPNFHLSLLLYIIMFFGPMLALILLAINYYRGKIKIWWYLHNRKISLFDRDKISGYKQSTSARRAMAYQAKSHQVSISEPIPMSPHANQATLQASLQHPSLLDPWAETSTTIDSSPGTALISALTTPTNSSSATATAFGMTKPAGYRLEPLPRKPLEPLPPPVPPHRNLSEPPISSTEARATSTEPDNAVSLRPVRAAPPPPRPAHGDHKRA